MKLVTQLKRTERTGFIRWSIEYQHDGNTLMEVQSDPFDFRDQQAMRNNYEYSTVRALKELTADPKFLSLMLQS